MRAVGLRPGAGPALIGRLVGAGRSSVAEAVHVLARRGVLEDRGERLRPAYFVAGSLAGRGHHVRGVLLRALNVVHQTGGVPLQTLALHLGVSRSEASRLATRLVDAGSAVRVRYGRTAYILPVAGSYADG